MKALGSIARSTAYLYIFTAVKMLAPLITLPYLTRVLSLEAYGIISYVKTYTTYVQLLIDYGFLFSATRAVVLARGSHGAISRIVSNTVLEKGFLALVAGLITALCCLKIPMLALCPSVVWLYYLSCVCSILTLDFLFRGSERMEFVTIPFVLAKTAVVLLTIVFVRDDGGMLLLPLFDIVGNLVSGAFSLYFAGHHFGVSIAFGEIKSWLLDIKESGVYFFSNFATTFLGAFTTIIAGFFLSASDIALWSVCMLVVSAAKAMYTPISNGIYPNVVITKNLNIVNKAAIMGSIPLLLGCMVIAAFGDDIMAIIGGDDYGAAGEYLKYLIPVLAFSFYSMLYGWPALGAIEKNKEVTISTIQAALLQIFLIVAVVSCGNCSLFSLAMCCCASEALLLVLRCIYVIKYRKLYATI